MKPPKEKEFYMIADFEGGELKKPVLLYEDGSSEIQCVMKFRDYADQRLRQYYDGIKYNMELLGDPARDLRGGFSLRVRHRYLDEVLDKVRQMNSGSCTIPVRELWQMFRRERIEIFITFALRQICKKLARRQRKASRRNTKADKQFLKETGYPGSRTLIIVEKMFDF